MRRGLLLACLAWPVVTAAEPIADPEADTPATIVDGREYLVPELSEDQLRVGDGPRPFRSRLSFSPGFGRLGSEPLYVMRVAFNPSQHLGWEASVGHNPGESVHALLHTLSAVVRYPLPWRIQPYGSLGYGMILVYPGESLNSDPVTKNSLTAGGGVELYIRDDVALRFEARSINVLGGRGEGGEVAAYRYAETTVAFAFYRGLDR